jgi:hypothetical protein
MQDRDTHHPLTGQQRIDAYRMALAAKLALRLLDLSHEALMELFPDELVALSCESPDRLAGILADGLALIARQEDDAGF